MRARSPSLCTLLLVALLVHVTAQTLDSEEQDVWPRALRDFYKAPNLITEKQLVRTGTRGARTSFRWI